MTNDLERTKGDFTGNGAGIDESMVAVFSSSNHDAEMEASAIQGVLESNGIPAMVVGSHMIPSLEVQVQVPAHLLTQARQLIREARQDGRRSADEAEAASEE
jgi:hypothetical protein